MNKFFRQFKYLAIMLVLAGAAFKLTEYVDHCIQSPLIDFQQEAAAGLLAALFVPAFAYNRSSSLNERLLTVLQLMILCVTALFGFTVELIVPRGVWLFLFWLVCADVATVTTFYMVDRLWKKNGMRPSGDDLLAWTKHLNGLLTIEAVLEERVTRPQSLERDGIAQYVHLDATLARIRAERQHLQNVLAGFGVRTHAVFVEEAADVLSSHPRH